MRFCCVVNSRALETFRKRFDETSLDNVPAGGRGVEFTGRFGFGRQTGGKEAREESRRGEARKQSQAGATIGQSRFIRSLSIRPMGPLETRMKADEWKENREAAAFLKELSDRLSASR